MEFVPAAAPRPALRPLSELGTLPADWRRAPRGGRRHELRAGEALYATLTDLRPHGRLAVAHARGAHWLFESERDGAAVAVREGGSGRPVAWLRADGADGACVLWAGRETFHWSGARLWMRRWAFRAADGRPLAGFHVRPMRPRPSGSLAFEPGAAELPHAPLLATLGWHLAVRALDAVATGAAAGMAG